MGLHERALHAEAARPARRPQKLAPLMALTSLIALSSPAFAGAPAQATTATNPPVISSVSEITPTADQTVVVTGSGFGTQRPFDGDSAYLMIADVTSGWRAGYAGSSAPQCGVVNGPADSVTVSVASWTNNKIVVTGFTGAYGGGYSFTPGDKVRVGAWNAQTGHGPACYTLTVGAHAAPSTALNANDYATCPGSGTASDTALPGGSLFDAVSDVISRGFGGVYAHISSAPTCRDKKSNPATSSWVMLQAGATEYTGCSRSSKVFVQAGIFYSYPATTPGSEHPFVEVDYPCLDGNGTYEVHESITSGTFGVEELGRSTSHANCPGIKAHAGGDNIDPTIDRVETTLNGACLWVEDLPVRYLGHFVWANLAAEVHTPTSHIPGTYARPLTFSNAHVYFGGAWHGFFPTPSDHAHIPVHQDETPELVPTDANTSKGSEGTGCQRRSPTGGPGWSLYVWSANENGKCAP